MACISEAQIKEAFSMFDQERTGLISTRDLPLVLRCLGFSDAPMEETYASSSGSITYPEVEHLVLQRSARSDSHEEAFRAFQAFDRRGVGRITLDDLREVADGQYPENLLQAVIDEIAERPTEGITYDEWDVVMKYLTSYSVTGYTDRRSAPPPRQVPGTRSAPVGAAPMGYRAPYGRTM
eukprot:NODE_2133_length_645_cov_7.353282_g2083_i0.p1 GENE.NODE_2133_length_645_cov_7.353282_g2083_i0~~NODE_2133_length_645_cov_7.353282_g2083_i0.p1  ORF type:complete len:180 (+),score=12.74 NODE_2133_length_645_cov_7.353282_g2083_i0:91-630(+)